MPSLIAEDIVSVQPMDRRIGQIFYLDYLYGTTKGDITSAGKMFDAKAGAANESDYSSDTINDESLATGDGAHTAYTSTLTYKPVIAGTLVITDGVETFTDDGDGSLVSSISAGNTGTIVYTTGVYSVVFQTNVVNGVVVYGDYRFNMEEDATGIGEVDLSLTSSTVTARTRKLKARWLLDAAYDLQKAHGRDAEAELLMAITSEIKNEIDQEICAELLVTADANTTVSFDAAPTSTDVPWIWRKEKFQYVLTQAANKIFQATKRATGNYIIAATDVCSLIENMNNFVRDGSVPAGKQPPAGPHKIGTLGGSFVIYKDPFYASGRFMVGFKGDSFLNCGYVYAPYLPIFVTPTIILDDFVYRRGIATAYGKKVINNKMFVGGTVTHLT